MHKLLLLLVVAGFAACQPAPPSGQDATKPAPASTVIKNESLEDLLARQPQDMQARYIYRHPRETLEFFEVGPGMTVVEALPGGGWYSKLLLPYLGSEGHLIGADYAIEMFPLFGFFSEEFVEGKKTWIADWTADAEEWRDAGSAPVSAFVFGSMPDDIAGTADRVLFIRALHNLNRFENEGAYLTSALADAYRALKPGGILGIVQHRAREDRPDDWSIGDHGYLKQSLVIDAVTKAGFEFIADNDLNANPKDQPGDDDVVWRLPPTLQSSRDSNDGLRARMEAIGESNRMTLKFRKPL